MEPTTPLHDLLAAIARRRLRRIAARRMRELFPELADPTTRDGSVGAIRGSDRRGSGARA